MELDHVRITVLVDDCVGYDVKGLLGEHGLSILIEGWKSNKYYKVLFDTGQTGHVLLHNVKRLGLNIKDLNAIVLSHRHYDHTGGLLKVLEEVQTYIIAHPEIFKPQIYIGEDNVRLDLGIPHSKSSIEGKGGKLILAKTPLELAPGIYFLGEIPRTTEYEEPWGNVYTLTDDGVLVKDKMLDDTGLAVKVNGKTLVIGGCSHSGIVNISRYALNVVGGEPEVVMGGFHLVNADMERIRKTVKGLKDIGFKKVYAGHCTGFLAERTFSLEYGGDFKRIHTGFNISI